MCSHVFHCTQHLPVGKRKAKVILGQQDCLSQIEGSSEAGHSIIICILLMSLLISLMSHLTFSTTGYLPAVTLVSENKSCWHLIISIISQEIFTDFLQTYKRTFEVRKQNNSRLFSILGAKRQFFV